MDNKESGLEQLEVAEAFVLDMLDIARENFKKDGVLLPVCFIGAQVNPLNGESLSSIRIITISPAQLGISMETSADTQRYTDCIRTICRACKAIMVVTIMEVWKAHVKDPEELHRRRHESLEKFPGREEGIQAMLEHHKIKFAKVWSVTITRDEQGRGTLGELEGPVIWEDAQGRFIGFITPPS